MTSLGTLNRPSSQVLTDILTLKQNRAESLLDYSVKIDQLKMEFDLAEKANNQDPLFSADALKALIAKSTFNGLKPIYRSKIPVESQTYELLRTFLHTRTNELYNSTNTREQPKEERWQAPRWQNQGQFNKPNKQTYSYRGNNNEQFDKNNFQKPMNNFQNRSFESTFGQNRSVNYPQNQSQNRKTNYQNYNSSNYPQNLQKNYQTYDQRAQIPNNEFRGNQN